MRKPDIRAYFVLALCLFIGACADTGALIQDGYNTVEAVAISTKNLQDSGVIKDTDAQQVKDSLNLEIMPALETAEDLYGQWLADGKIHGTTTIQQEVILGYVEFATKALDRLNKLIQEWRDNAPE